MLFIVDLSFDKCLQSDQQKWWWFSISKYFVSWINDKNNEEMKRWKLKYYFQIFAPDLEWRRWTWLDAVFFDFTFWEIFWSFKIPKYLWLKAFDDNFLNPLNLNIHKLSDILILFHIKIDLFFFLEDSNELAYYLAFGIFPSVSCLLSLRYCFWMENLFDGMIAMISFVIGSTAWSISRSFWTCMLSAGWKKNINHWIYNNDH